MYQYQWVWSATDAYGTLYWVAARIDEEYLDNSRVYVIAKMEAEWHLKEKLGTYYDFRYETTQRLDTLTGKVLM